MPSSITTSTALSVCAIACRWAARFRAVGVSGLVEKYRQPDNHTAQIGTVVGLPSGLVVAIQK